jgi:hypothetical protein
MFDKKKMVNRLTQYTWDMPRMKLFIFFFHILNSNKFFPLWRIWFAKARYCSF